MKSRHVLEGLSKKVGEEGLELLMERLDIDIGSGHCCFQWGLASDWGDGSFCHFKRDSRRVPRLHSSVIGRRFRKHLGVMHNLDVMGGCNNQFVGLKVRMLSNKKALVVTAIQPDSGRCFDRSLLRSMTVDFRDRVSKIWCRSSCFWRALGAPKKYAGVSSKRALIFGAVGNMEFRKEGVFKKEGHTRKPF